MIKNKTDKDNEFLLSTLRMKTEMDTSFDRNCEQIVMKTDITESGGSDNENQEK